MKKLKRRRLRELRRKRQQQQQQQQQQARRGQNQNRNQKRWEIESVSDSSESESSDESEENDENVANDGTNNVGMNKSGAIGTDAKGKGIDNVSIVFNDAGCPSIKHHAANFMLIPSIYEYNRFQPNLKQLAAAKNEQTAVCTFFFTWFCIFCFDVI